MKKLKYFYWSCMEAPDTTRTTQEFYLAFQAHTFSRARSQQHNEWIN
jgi:hypothetical protein